ncbi:MAG: response regulator, partial [Alphaproteobacteria bacterium]|nr:response regulator [Alphaproteobacteria bacterium]
MLSSQTNYLGSPFNSADTDDLKPLGLDQTLLLVDDDAPFVSSLSRALERRGFAVLSAQTLKEARLLAERHRPGSALLDLRLGNQNGLELVGVLRRLCPNIRIVVVTGYGNIASAVMATKTGAVD